MRNKTFKSSLCTAVLVSILIIGCAKHKKETAKTTIKLEISKHSKTSKFTSYKGLIMAGYQGWFNAPSDGADRGWNHYRKGKIFEPGACTIDLRPDMTEYKKQYKTSFQLPDGKPAYVFSSYDKSTI